MKTISFQVRILTLLILVCGIFFLHQEQKGIVHADYTQINCTHAQKTFFYRKKNVLVITSPKELEKCLTDIQKWEVQSVYYAYPFPHSSVLFEFEKIAKQKEIQIYKNTLSAKFISPKTLRSTGPRNLLQ